MALASALASCGGGPGSRSTTYTPPQEEVQIRFLELETPGAATPVVPTGITPLHYTYKIVGTYPHDRKSYTQGLFWHDGYLYESTGLYGKSSLLKVDVSTGNAVNSIKLDDGYFAEGIALYDGKIYQITWQEGRGFIYDAVSFNLLEEFTYNGEGWGLTEHDGELYMSDGSNRIHVIDPVALKKKRTINVVIGDLPVEYLNELEWVNGEIWANVYTTDRVVRIDPGSGVVTGVIDLSGLLTLDDKLPDTDVLNGIAYDPATGRIFVTGKNWNKLFEIELVKKP